ncbi:MAG TPA: pyruvate dehydrogenase (acetyl-transferring), homodimeric type [Gammaproteobacteria bacterium]|nr:pyruvate dehydrogenase (acetyl-transferring), homodimeric type [Gammaproteobacteria bacterium]
MVHESQNKDIDPIETQEWLDALDSIVHVEGPQRAKFIIEQLLGKAQLAGFSTDLCRNTPYCNTIHPEQEPQMPGDSALEQRSRALTRWNALAMVVRAQKVDPSIGGHIGTFASSATLFDVGLNHFWKSPKEEGGGDLIYFQGHASPGMYARSFLLGDLTEEQLVHFRRETDKKGLSSYPHPWLMPDYWQFPTVSMGLGPLQAIYQARFMKYLEHRGLSNNPDRKVWCFCGDGEMDEPESTGALSIASREKLDNLIFVINCNLQRLDGPVRGNGKIIQELEAIFKGAGWEVIKVVWGDLWDPLFARDKSGKLLQRMEEAVDGDYQNYKAKGGAYTREHFFGIYPETQKLVAEMSDEEIWHLNRGGHDPKKVYAAYAKAIKTKGKPTVILAKTIKGYGLGKAGEALNIAHNVKKIDAEDIMAFRDRFNIPIRDEDIEKVPFYRPSEDSPEIRYLRKLREKLGGPLPFRRRKASEAILPIPDLAIFDNQLKSTGDREISTTMAFVRILSALIKDKSLSKRIVPIVPDEARTFGMEGLFRQLGIYAPEGQKYEPVDKDQVMFYKEMESGQILEEGITEAGSFCSWLAAASAYSSHNLVMIPFFIFYSMFGFQRIGDLAWAAGDMRSRGFLLGGTSGRTTLNGEGLQHQDGHSHIMAGLVPNCISYDPTFAYELAVIIHHGLQRMISNEEDVFFYITLMNENYAHPDMPQGVEEGIIRGMYLFKKDEEHTLKVQLLGSGAIFQEVIEAAHLLKKDFQVSADIWSVTSFNELQRNGREVARHNLLNPDAKQTSYVETCMKDTKGPVIAATDYVKLYAEQIRGFIPRRYICLGTDGFGRSDTRTTLRNHFEVDRFHIAYAAIQSLAEDGHLDQNVVKKAKQLYQIHDKPDPAYC